MQLVKVILLCISIIPLVSSIGHAHRPVIVKSQSTKDKPVIVEKPEISYAYYGKLAGEPHLKFGRVSLIRKIWVDLESRFR